MRRWSHEQKIKSLLPPKYAIALYAWCKNTVASKRFVYFDHGETAPQLEQRFRKQLISSMHKLTSTGRSVFVVKPVPEMWVDVPHFIARASMLTKRAQCVSIPYPAYLDRNRLGLSMLADAQQQCGVRLLDPTQALCHAGFCIGSIAGRPLYFDDDHLSEYGNKLLVPMFREISGDWDSPQLVRRASRLRRGDDTVADMESIAQALPRTSERMGPSRH